MNRLPPGIQEQGAHESQMCHLLQEAELLDLWRIRNPDVLQYSCYSSSYSTLSRIDLVLSNEVACQIIKDIVYQPRGVSDHLLMTVSVKLRG